MEKNWLKVRSSFQRICENGWFPAILRNHGRWGSFQEPMPPVGGLLEKDGENAFSKLETIATFATDMGATALF